MGGESECGASKFEFRVYVRLLMNGVQLMSLILSLAVFTGCETPRTAGMGTQESKRLAALQQRRRQEQPDEAQQNLWSAQENNLNRDGNPVRRY